MISKSDVVLLLMDLQENGENVLGDITELYRSDNIPLHILKKINDSRPLDLLSFYEKLRWSYNNKKSKLYINIMKSNENTINDVNTVLTTLSALLNQILLFNTEDKNMFYQHSRADEIVKVLNIYFTTKDLSPAYKLLSLIKADIKALDLIKK